MRLIAAVALLAALSVPVHAAPDSAASAVAGRALGPTPIVSDLRELVDGIGGRPTGSPALDRAVDWGLAKFKAAGLENVRAEPYTIPRVWLPVMEALSMTAAAGTVRDEDWERLRAAAMPYAANTPIEGLTAEVADVGRGDAAGFAAAGEKVRGRWALVHSEPMKGFADLFQEYLVTPGIFAAAKKAGAVGVLYVSTRPGKLLYRHNFSVDGSVADLPGLVVEREGALRLGRMLEDGAHVRVRAVVTADVKENVTAKNVVGEIKGRDKSKETIVLGAHLDSWDLARGALDNGCNAALVVDVARTIRSVPAARRPRRTLRFVLYTGEELGTYGSWGEVKHLRDTLDRVKAQIVFDEGTGRTTGFSLGGRADLAAATGEALREVAGLGPFVQTVDAFVGTDNYDYLVEGVPTLVANQAEARYLPDYHAESDTFDKADLHELKTNVAIAAALVWNLAERKDEPAPRQTRAQVEELLKATGLDAQMRTFGLWDDFAAGKRGRRP